MKPAPQQQQRQRPTNRMHASQGAGKFLQCDAQPQQIVERFKGRSHIRCALLRCAGKNVSCFLLAERSNAQRACERPFMLC